MNRRFLGKIWASSDLILAAGLWGFGFIASAWALEALTPLEITFLRFALAVLVGLPFILSAPVRQALRSNLKLSFLPAIWLLGTLIFQTWGLRFTTPTKSGFVTTLYVVIVPILEAVVSRRHLSWKMWSCVAIALAGTALIVGVGVTDLNVGDLLTLISAFFAATQIYWMGEVSRKIRFPFAFNVAQSFCAAVLCAPFVNMPLLMNKIGRLQEFPAHVWWGMLSLSVGSTVIAFYLQVRAQAKLSPTVSSLLFLLESPFAMIFAILLMNEVLSATEALGAALIFTSAIAATLIESRQKKV